MRSSVLCVVCCVAANTAIADPLPDMAGTWRGSGWAKETPEGPRETVRCRINNAFDTASLTLTMTGRCAVPGRTLTLSGSLTGDQTGTQITGQWSNPDGVGKTRISGVQQDGLVAFHFRALDVASGRSIAQNVEWRVGPETLRLRATNRKDPSIQMSDIQFTR